MIHFLGNSEHILQCRLLIKTEVFIVIWVLKIFNNNDAKIYVELFPPIWPQVSDNLVKQFLRFQKGICQLSKIIKEKKKSKVLCSFQTELKWGDAGQAEFQGCEHWKNSAGITWRLHQY